MELQERKLFEYFIVVALHKTKAGMPYLPEVTQQFPLKVKEGVCENTLLFCDPNPLVLSGFCFLSTTRKYLFL